MDFKTWLLLEGQDIFQGEYEELFIQDVRGDIHFPSTSNFDIMLKYLSNIMASREAKQCLVSTYEEYLFTCKDKLIR